MPEDGPVFSGSENGCTLEHVRRQSIQGGLTALGFRGISFAVQTAAMIVLARLLSPDDFGLQGMLLTATAFLNLFKDAGLSVATVQREVITKEQATMLFWVNGTVGLVLAGVLILLAPVLVEFYREPRLLWMVTACAPVFICDALTVQHVALMCRALRFNRIALIDFATIIISCTIGVSAALLGFGYWALVATMISGPAIRLAFVWRALPWRPGRPVMASGLRSMLTTGRTVTLNQLVLYFAYNTDRSLLGRFWGAEALGFYTRAWQTTSVPLQQIYTSVGNLAFSSLSRMQSDVSTLCRSFLQGYGLLVSATMLIVVCSAIFAEEVIGFLFGSKWLSAAPVLRFTSPAILGHALIQPFGWFLQATDRAKRSLQMALVITPAIIIGIIIGLQGGIVGVAVGYSSALALMALPIILWAIHDTGITGSAYWCTVRPPLTAAMAAAGAGILFKALLHSTLTPVAFLLAGLSLTCGVYAFVVLQFKQQRVLYAKLIKEIFSRLVPGRTETV